ncbi:MAG: hypothetical protein HRU19_21405 [Pseudobacteriovorax sp.]|nr:hypothetical protein [Pseudobacteriovorax sp.]
MPKLHRSIALFFFSLLWLFTQQNTANAQVVNTQERFQDLFISAGYGTAFGASLGAAVLPFQSNPEKNLRLVAIGASIGFIAGSVMGSYLILTPDSPTTYTKNKNSSTRFLLEPIFSHKSTISGVQGKFLIARF